MQNSAYSVLIPARNEANHIATILKSLLSQTVPPSYILVISDGSTDDTVSEINNFSLSNDTEVKIELIERVDRGFSAVGTPYITETYNDGFEILEQRDEPFLMILGADSVLEMQYSEKLLIEMNQNPNLAATSGICQGESISKRHIRGTGRLIRTSFFRKLHFRFPFAYGWEDSIPYIAKAAGYDVYHILDAKIKLLRATGSSAKNYLFWGMGMRSLGYTYLIAIGRGIKHILKRNLQRGVNLIAGYFKENPYIYPQVVRDYVKADSQFRVKSYLMKNLP
ncbi:MAG: glycosyltransferase family A protein [Candidatus Hodarchaeales archaeon]|jgi:glycosyltransferase involved in cell wall biosynthesis